jgi:SAM-dependent methyltransferase
MEHRKIGPGLEAGAKVGFPERSRWDKEYDTYNAIPSSHRSSPSKALVAANAAIDYAGISRAIDLGCGNGRNSIYLANKGIKTAAIDFSTSATELADQHIAASGASELVDIVRGEVSKGLPFNSTSTDLVVDSYTSCHFLDPHIQIAYFNEIERVLRPGGQLYWSALSVEDEYYAKLSNTHPDENVIVDPLNDLGKRLYEKSEMENELPTNLNVDMAFDISFTDVVDGEEYTRSILAGVFKK